MVPCGTVRYGTVRYAYGTCEVFLAVAAFCLRTSSSILLIDRRSLLFFLRMAFLC